MGANELVVLCSEDGQPIGTAPKSTVHGADTPLHLAFSAYVFDADGRFLATRRARHKQTFAGVRTNSCCGHPAPGESGPAAVARRLESELGLAATDIAVVLPGFRYQARDRTGLLENELCPVYRVVVRDPGLTLDPDEVDSAWWASWSAFASEPDPNQPDAGDPLSQWAALQVRALAALGPDPLLWPVGDPALLPPALGSAPTGKDDRADPLDQADAANSGS